MTTASYKTGQVLSVQKTICDTGYVRVVATNIKIHLPSRDYDKWEVIVVCCNQAGEKLPGAADFRMTHEELRKLSGA